MNTDTLYRLYDNSTTRVFIELENLDSLIDYMEYSDKTPLFRGDEGYRLNAFLHKNHETGLSGINGSIRVNDNTLAYFGHDRKGSDGAYDFIIKQNDTDDVTQLAYYRKGTFMYIRMIALALEGGQLSNEELHQIHMMESREDD